MSVTRAAFESWSIVISAISAVAFVVGMFVAWPKRAKPRILSVKDCIFNKKTEVFGLRLLIDNKGQRDCSIIERRLFLSGGEEIELDKNSLLTTIPAGQTIEIDLTDLWHKQARVDTFTGEAVQKRYLVSPKKGWVEIKFNTGNKIRRKIDFNIS
jgi:hypothetical protein